MSKRESVKTWVRAFGRGSYTVNELHFILTGSKSGAKWHDTVIQVSKSTIRRALDEMIQGGELRGFYPIGHCYDEFVYRIPSLGIQKTGEKDE